MSPEDKQDLAELRKRMHDSSLGDRPASIAAHDFKRLLELGALEESERKGKGRRAGPPVDHYPLLKMQLEALGLPLPVREHRFHPPRRWRFDFAWINHGIKLALEVEGGVWMKGGGAHRHASGFVLDLDKYNQAALDGWKVLRVQPEWLKLDDGRAILLVEQGLKAL